MKTVHRVLDFWWRYSRPASTSIIGSPGAKPAESGNSYRIRKSAIGYVRFLLKEQATEGASLDTQWDNIASALDPSHKKRVDYPLARPKDYRMKFQFDQSVSPATQAKVKARESAIESGWPGAGMATVKVRALNAGMTREEVIMEITDVHTAKTETIRCLPDDPPAQIEKQAKEAFGRVAQTSPVTRGARTIGR